MNFDELLSNPVVVGVLTAAGLVTAKVAWGRIMGAPADNEKSLPTQIRELDSKMSVALATIDTTLKLMANDKMHENNKTAALQESFWDHMDKYHGAPIPKRRRTFDEGAE